MQNARIFASRSPRQRSVARQLAGAVVLGSALAVVPATAMAAAVPVTATAMASAPVGEVLTPARATAPCPSGWYCFYENRYYNRDRAGWKLNYNTTTSGSFNNPPPNVVGDRRNQLVSIINNGNRTICVYDDLNLRPDTLLVRVPPYGDVPNLADIGHANQADYWKVLSGTSSCS